MIMNHAVSVVMIMGMNSKKPSIGIHKRQKNELQS